MSILLWKIAGLQNYINTQDNIPEEIQKKTIKYVEDYRNTKNKILKIISNYKFDEEGKKLIKSFKQRII